MNCKINLLKFEVSYFPIYWKLVDIVGTIAIRGFNKYVSHLSDEDITCIFHNVLRSRSVRESRNCKWKSGTLVTFRGWWQVKPEFFWRHPVTHYFLSLPYSYCCSSKFIDPTTQSVHNGQSQKSLYATRDSPYSNDLLQGLYIEDKLGLRYIVHSN